MKDIIVRWDAEVIEELAVKQKDLYSLYDTRNFVFGKYIIVNMNIPINHNTVTLRIGD